MNETDAVICTTLRIPGNWSHPGELIERMPEGIRLTPEALILPDETEIEFTPMPPDDQFAGVFKTACRQPAGRDEVAIVDGYTVNICLTGPGGSLEAARTMMRAGAAIVRAGGAGVFVDNSVLAHGGRHWLEMAEDGGTDALSFAFAGIVRGPQEVRTIGMHVLGLPEVVMRREDADADEMSIVEVIRYMSASDQPIGHGHLLGDEHGPRFQAVATASEFDAPSPLHNPFGRLKLVSIKEIAQGN